MKQYYILSGIDNGIFVYHNVEDKSTHDKNVSYLVYNVLRDINIVKNDDMNVFIYEHDLTDKSCDLIIIQNKNKHEFEDFDKDNLENIFAQLTVHLINNDILTIELDNNNYKTSLKSFNYNTLDKLIIESLEYMVI